MRILVLLLVLAGCGGAPRSDELPELAVPLREPVRDYAIVPGERVGPVYIGMPLSQLLDVLGDPEESYGWGMEGYPGMKYTYGGTQHIRALQIVVRNQDQRVRSIGVTDPNYQTARGIRAGGSSARAMVAGPTHTRRSSLGDHYCYREGMEAAIDQRGTIVFVKVFPAADYPRSYCAP